MKLMNVSTAILLLAASSAWAGDVASSIFEMPEGLYGTGQYLCGTYLQFPIVNHDQLILESVTNPLLLNVACGVSGQRDTYTVDPANNKLARLGDCTLERFSRNSFRSLCKNAAGVVGSDVVYMLVKP